MDLLTKVELAKIAYEPSMSLIRQRLKYMFNIPKTDIKYIYVKRTDTEGVIFKSNNDCICAFSGTESKKDLLHDLMFIPTPYFEGYLHYGFNNIIKLLTDEVVNTVKELFGDNPPDKIYSFGHSLGGAIAFGVADIIKIYQFPEVTSEIRTWGCPNGWSSDAIEGFNFRHQMVVNYINNWDIVTKMLCITTGRPGVDVKLKGKCGHSLDGYIHNMRGL